MTHLRALAFLAVPLALLGLIAGSAHAQVGEPDLAVTNISTDPFPPEPGEEVDLTVEVTNEGDGESNPFNYTFTLDNEAFGEAQTYDDTLAGGDSVVLNATTTWTVETGGHAIGATVDHQDSLSSEDTNTDNDEGSQAYTIGPDIAVRDVQADPSSPLEGDPVELTVTVENVADPDDVSASTDNFPVVFRVDGEQATTAATVSGLDPQETTTVTRTWTAENPGQRSVTAVGDVSQSIPDRDRSNNEADPTTVDVRPSRPDLVVADATYSPDPVEPDRRVTFTADVANNGNEDAGEHDVSLLVDGEEVDRTTIDGVTTDERTQAELAWQATAGNHDVEIQVDPDGNVTETDDTNNAWAITIPVGADLVVEDFVVQPEEPRASDRVRFTVEIGNDGLAVDEPVEVAFDVDGEPLDVQQIPGVEAANNRNVTSTPWNATVGDHEVEVLVDPGDDIDEVDDENNGRTRQLTVGEPEPDLAVLSAGIDPAVAEDGEEVTVRAPVENGGPRDAEAFDVTAEIDGETIGEVRLDELPSGEQRTLDFGNWTAEDGPHELAIEIDPADEVTETDEANNQLVETFGIGTDLTVRDLSVSPTDPDPGEEVAALAIVENNGTRSTPEANLSFALDDGTVADATIDPLDPNGQTSVEATFTATSGGTLAATIDPDDTLVEFDEDNNRAETPLELAGDAAPPDLTVDAITVDGDLANDDPITLTARIANVGEGPAPQAEVDFRVDGSSIGTTTVDGLAAGGQANASLEWSAESGATELEVVVDALEEIDESDETNNAETASLESGPIGIPIGAATAVIGLLGAASVAGQATSSKRKPPKR